MALYVAMSILSWISSSSWRIWKSLEKVVLIAIIIVSNRDAWNSRIGASWKISEGNSWGNVSSCERHSCSYCGTGSITAAINLHHKNISIISIQSFTWHNVATINIVLINGMSHWLLVDLVSVGIIEDTYVWHIHPKHFSTQLANQNYLTWGIWPSHPIDLNIIWSMLELIGKS